MQYFPIPDQRAIVPEMDTCGEGGKCGASRAVAGQYYPLTQFV